MRLPIAPVLLCAATFTLTAALASAMPQDGRAPAAARAGRVEQGLLPATVVAGRPIPTASLAERMIALKTPGVSIAVINGGVVEWAKGYGVTDTGTPTPVTERTLFQAASISKPVAAMAALRLVAQGTLALDEPVNHRLASWKVPDNTFTATEKVTLRRLLNHSAGLTVHGFGGYTAGTPVPTTIQVLDGQPPANSAPIRVDVVPGTLWRYSGGGYTIVQQLLEDVSGRPFPALLSDVVLRPLGMNDSTYEQPLPAGREGAAASGHRSTGSPIAGRFHTYPELAAAGLWTTPTDLARFLLEIQRAVQGTSSVLSRDMARQMVTDLKGGYGLGLTVQGTGPTASFGHGGSNAGFRCSMTMYVGSGQGAVVMTNGDQGGRLAGEILRAIAREYDWPSGQAVEKTAVRVERPVLMPLTGRYQLQGRTVVVALEGNTLFLVDGLQRMELFPQSATRFFEVVQNGEIEFVPGTDGRPSHFVINGQLKATRLADAPGKP